MSTSSNQNIVKVGAMLLETAAATACAHLHLVSAPQTEEEIAEGGPSEKFVDGTAPADLDHIDAILFLVGGGEIPQALYKEIAATTAKWAAQVHEINNALPQNLKRKP